MSHAMLLRYDFKNDPYGIDHTSYTLLKTLKWPELILFKNSWNQNEECLNLLVNNILNSLFMLSFMIIIVSLTLTRNLYLFGLQLCLVQITGMLNLTVTYYYSKCPNLIFWSRYYWAHRFLHETNIGWSSHQVHHSSEARDSKSWVCEVHNGFRYETCRFWIPLLDFNLSTGVRQSIFQKYYQWPFYIPMALAGIPTSLFMIHMGRVYHHWRVQLKVDGQKSLTDPSLAVVSECNVCMNRTLTAYPFYIRKKRHIFLKILI